MTILQRLISVLYQTWSSKRISRVSKSILRLALYEIIYMKDIPCQVSVNEAVELAKKFDSEESYTFVNGILGAYLRSKDVCSASEE